MRAKADIGRHGRRNSQRSTLLWLSCMVQSRAPCSGQDWFGSYISCERCIAWTASLEVLSQ